MVAENSLSVNDLLYPMFVLPGEGQKQEIASMPGQYRLSLDLLLGELEEVSNLGIKAVAVFPCLDDSFKDSEASEGLNPEGLYPNVLRAIKQNFPDIALMTDIAMDPYSSDGHDGLVKDGEILNDETLEILGEMAVIQAEAGADIMGPSDMMDGRVGHIRDVLDEEGHETVSIMSYSAKYASAYYGPFRDALDSAPKFGDKKTYQMDPSNGREALREAVLDEEEGADILMVKPALSYLDVIQTLKSNIDLPIAAYNVSGEYAMIKAAAEKGWIDGDAVMMETLLSMKRAGADIILTYFAKEAAKFIRQS